MQQGRPPRLREFDLPRKPNYTQGTDASEVSPISTLIVSSKGQIVLPAATRRRLGLGAGSRLEVTEEGDGLRLRILRSVPAADVKALAGMVKAPQRGVARRLEDFDPASMVARARTAKP